MLISTKGKICIDSSYDALQEFRHSPFVLINTYKQLPKSGSLQNKRLMEFHQILFSPSPSKNEKKPPSKNEKKRFGDKTI